MAEKINFNQKYSGGNFDLPIIYSIPNTLKRTLFLAKFCDKSLISSFDNVLNYTDGSIAMKFEEKKIIKSIERYVQQHLQLAAFWYETSFKELADKYLVDDYSLSDDYFGITLSITTIEEDLDMINYSTECKPTKFLNQIVYYNDMNITEKPKAKKCIEYLPSFRSIEDEDGTIREVFSIHKVVYPKYTYNKRQILNFGENTIFSDIINNLDNLRFNEKEMPDDLTKRDTLEYQIKKLIYLIHHSLRSACILEIVLSLYKNKDNYPGISKASRYNPSIKVDGIKEYFKIKARALNLEVEPEEEIIDPHKTIMNELNLPD